MLLLSGIRLVIGLICRLCNAGTDTYCMGRVRLRVFAYSSRLYSVFFCSRYNNIPRFFNRLVIERLFISLKIA